MQLPDAGKAVKVFVETLHEFQETRRQGSGDDRYVQIRQKAASLLERYANDRTNLDLVDECDQIVRDLDNLDTATLTPLNQGRANANLVYISAQSRRTHYAAYMAGKWAAEQKLGSHFKAWMHNSAADGAIALYEAISKVLPKANPSDEKGDWDILKVFASGALCDASRFLTFADDFYPNCATTRYNEAKLVIYQANTTDEVLHGVNLLKRIKPCTKECHPAELSWHADNYSCFTMRDTEMNEIIATHCGQEISKVETVLDTNRRVAEEIKEGLGDRLWEGQSDRNRVVLLATATGIVLITYLVLSAAGDVHLLKLLQAHMDLWTTHIGTVGYPHALLGGGGLGQVLSVMAMGGGGLA